MSSVNRTSSPAASLSLLASLALVPGCGLLLPQVDGQSIVVTEHTGTPQAVVAEVEVRDRTTMALVSGAVLEVSTDIEGYTPEVTLDALGVHHVWIEVRQKRSSTAEQIGAAIIVGDQYAGERWVREIRLRARAGDRRSRTYLATPSQLPPRLALWLEP